VVSPLPVGLKLLEPEFFQRRQIIQYLPGRHVRSLELIDHLKDKLLRAKLNVILLQVAVPVRSEEGRGRPEERPFFISTQLKVLNSECQ
jgi:hypothetical protein